MAREVTWAVHDDGVRLGSECPERAPCGQLLSSGHPEVVALRCARVTDGEAAAPCHEHRGEHRPSLLAERLRVPQAARHAPESRFVHESHSDAHRPRPCPPADLVHAGDETAAVGDEAPLELGVRDRRALYASSHGLRSYAWTTARGGTLSSRSVRRRLLPRLRAVRALLVPVKSFAKAKGRLAGVLDASERRALAEDLASRVIGAASGMPVFVACDDRVVAGWARARGADVLWTPGLGLSGAVARGVERLASLGVDMAVVSHADLPLVTSFAGLGTDGAVTLVPDRHLAGTNVACVPTRSGFRFSYGLGSFARHRAEARRLGLGPRVVYDWSLACDLDVPGDLVLVR